MKNLLHGFSFIRQGLSLICQPGLRRYAVIPVLINILVFALMGWWLWHRFGLWMESLPLLGRWGDFWLISVIQTLLRVLFAIALFLLSLFSFTLVANLIGAPFNSLLSEQVESRLRGTTPPSQSWSALLASVPTTMMSEVRKLIYLCLWLIPLTILYFIPVVQSVAPFLTLLFGAWMFSIEYLDYPLGNRGKGFGEVRRFAKTHRSRAVGFGSAVTILTAIPVINLIAMPVAVAAATALSVAVIENPEQPAQP